MDSIVKRAREVGTSAGVLLPRNWLNKHVVVTLLEISNEKIFQEVMEIIFKEGLNEEVKGVYLFGSYARGDFDFNSDIDIMVITEKTNRLISSGKYEILAVSEENFSKGLKDSLNYRSALMELTVLLNRELIERYRSKKIQFDFKKNLAEIANVVKINKGTVDICLEKGKFLSDGVIYSIVLRLRELFMIKRILSGEKYSKKDFLDLVGEKIYSAYSRVKRDEREINDIMPEEVAGLFSLSTKWIKELKGRKRALKA